MVQNHLLTASPNTPTLSYSTFFPSAQAAISTAVSDQTTIGWDNALTGLLAVSWMEVARHGNRPPWEADRSIQAGIKGLFNRAQSLWEGQNQALHGSKEQEHTKAYTVDSAAIRYYHSRPYLLAMGDRHYCKRPLLQILRGAPATRRRWLMRVRQARADYIRDGRLQRHIHSYFPPKHPQPQDPPTEIKLDSTPAKLLHPHQNQHLEDRTIDQRITTQRTINSFFPSASTSRPALLHLAKRPPQPPTKPSLPDRRRGRVLADSLLA
jgi:hypothetical protein